MPGTNALLADFVENGSEEAFREIVAAYVNLVYSTALRIVNRDQHLAEDISQNVFIDLAKKAARLSPEVQLGGWLYRHTCFTASKAMRRERRQKMRELRAVELHVIDDFTEENLTRVTPVLDEAINKLGAADRSVVLLRFFEQLDFSSIGDNLGCTEDAARVRLSRALGKLGTFLRRRGVTLSAAALAFLLGTKATVAAPAGLAGKISYVALACSAKASLSLAAIKQACLTKLNVAVASLAGTAAVIVVVLTRTQTPPKNVPPSKPPAIVQSARVPAVASASPSASIQPKTLQPVLNRENSPASGQLVSPASMGGSSLKVAAAAAPKADRPAASPLLKSQPASGPQNADPSVPKVSGTNLFLDASNALWLEAMGSNRSYTYPYLSNRLARQQYTNQQVRPQVPSVPTFTNPIANPPSQPPVQVDSGINRSSDLFRTPNPSPRGNSLRGNSVLGSGASPRRPNEREVSREQVLP